MKKTVQAWKQENPEAAHIVGLLVRAIARGGESRRLAYKIINQLQDKQNEKSN